MTILGASDGNWTFGPGDNTPWGWIITISYFVGAAMCVRAWRREDEAFLRGGRGLRPRFWVAAAAVLLLLGINKQLDLQTLMTDIGRRAAKSEGWYGQRRVVQAALIGAVALVGAGAIAWCAWSIRGAWRRYRIAALGLAYLCFFIFLRAASFHHVDTVLYKIPGLGMFVNRFLEFGGIVLIAWAAHRERHVR